MPITQFSNPSRRSFLTTLLGSLAALSWPGCGGKPESLPGGGVFIRDIREGEDLFHYMERVAGGFGQTLYRQLIGAANEYKEGDEAIQVAAADPLSRERARILLSNTTLGQFAARPILPDIQGKLIAETTDPAMSQALARWTMGQLKSYFLSAQEAPLRQILGGLNSDVIGCVVKLCSNDELIALSQKIWNPLPGSHIGQKGYLGARIQPNSPTDNIEDIVWQVFDAFAYAVGDVVIGCNPVSSDPTSVAAIERALHELRQTFGLTDILPHCVLAHIDIQADIARRGVADTGIWFQSLGGTDGANTVFDITAQKLIDHADTRGGKWGLYFETGQGADFSNGQAFGVDMVVLESHKYGLARVLSQRVALAQIRAGKKAEPWVHLNDVAGFIGPEVFAKPQQLIRCCLEDIVMGKLHGLTIGLDVCSTLHMDVSLKDLDDCLAAVMPANPAYLMGLPTKTDPMLGYLSTAYQDHVRLRKQFGYRTDDKMTAFFNRLGVIDAAGEPTNKFGDPAWVYVQYERRKGNPASEQALYQEAKAQMDRVRGRGVWLAEGYGQTPADMEPKLEAEIQRLYEDSRKAIWQEWPTEFVDRLPPGPRLQTEAVDRRDYILHPGNGEKLDDRSVSEVMQLRQSIEPYNVQLVISDGLCPSALSDSGHVLSYLGKLLIELEARDQLISPNLIVIRGGRVRAGYRVGELLFGRLADQRRTVAIIHMIGERPGSGHHTFSAYITIAEAQAWANRSNPIDHNHTKVISGIADTAKSPLLAAKETAALVPYGPYPPHRPKGLPTVWGPRMPG